MFLGAASSQSQTEDRLGSQRMAPVGTYDRPSWYHATSNGHDDWQRREESPFQESPDRPENLVIPCPTGFGDGPR